ncbi:hypothetical protein LAZ67_15002657 [Cordylochernes scorpioides]|uniref:Alpha-2-macroglobulin bait region domain-containing protein n=1 Tax=Cordylochernes scorpioides TaxID=51811 RepID=A0ABY6LEJ5_9ARAC|nr:hypothetical protein LAZ67_15002657 [Cordylochernes scorpioides]
MTQTLPLSKNGKEDEQLNNHVLSDVDIEEPAPDTMVNRQTESSESDRPQRTRTIPKRFDDYVLATTNETIPKDYEEAITCEDKKHWENAMLEEIQNMYSHQVWELVPRPVNAKVVKSKWVFKISKDQENKTYKARLVAMGYNQIPGRDYNESFSPVIKNATLRTILSMAATKDSVIKLFDVKAAYLNGNIENTIFMEQPAGFVQDRNKVCKLNKSIYGLPQSGRSWYEKFSQVLHDCGLEKLKSDPCLFKWKNEDKYFYVGIYVDDFITVSDSEDTSNRFINKLRHHLEIKDVTCKGMFLGIKIIQDKEGISLQQSHYVQQILQKYGMENCKEVPTPGSKEINLDNHIEDDNCEQHTYQEALGMLMFLAVNTRPDIAYITSKLSQYSKQPKQMHWTAIKRVMRYLRGTIDLGVKFERGKTGILKSYTDASWSTTHDGKSYGGYVLKLGEATIDWKSSKQPLVALSTMEAEMIAACESCCQIKWIINLLRELEEWNFMEKPTAIYTDSQSLINWISSPKQSSRCRHINRKYHFLRDCYESRDICLLYKPSQDLEADIFTKDLSRDQMKKHLESLSIVGIKPKHWFIAAPRSLRVDVPETVLLSGTDIGAPTELKLTLSTHPGRREVWSRQVYVGQDQNFIEPITLPKDGLPISQDGGSSHYVVLSARAKDFYREALLLVNPVAGYIIIQTDKPIYTPQQKDHCRPRDCRVGVPHISLGSPYTRLFPELAKCVQLVNGTADFALSVDHIRNHQDIGWFPDIAGKKLVVEVIVTEESTGKRESLTDSRGIFASHAYRISFKNCVNDFKPGLPLFIRAVVLYTQGDKAPNVPVFVSVRDQLGRPVNVNTTGLKSNEEGEVLFTVGTLKDHTSLSIHMRTQDRKMRQDFQAVAEHTVIKFASDSNGYLALVPAVNHTLKVGDLYETQVFNRLSDKSAKLKYLVVSRGRILTYGDVTSNKIQFTITQDMVPRSRLVVWTHHFRSLVADSQLLTFQSLCSPYVKVTLEPQFEEKSPGMSGRIQIKGPPNTLVGLLAVDKAVYLLKKNSQITTQKSRCPHISLGSPYTRLCPELAKCVQLVNGTADFALSVDHIRIHQDIGWFPDIAGKKMVVEVIVTEESTGKRESLTDSRGIFASHAYRISFKNCVNDFKPGLPLFIRAVVLYTQGDKAPNVPVFVSVRDQLGRPVNVNTTGLKSNEEGEVLFTVGTLKDHTSLSIHMRTQDRKMRQDFQAVAEHTVIKFASDSNGYLALVPAVNHTLKSKLCYLIPCLCFQVGDLYETQVFNRLSDKSAKLKYLVVSRGRILTYGDVTSNKIQFTITQDMVPRSRLVVWTHHFRSLVADSQLLTFQSLCSPYVKVTLEPQFEEKSPGMSGRIQIKGPPNTLVGLLAVDKAVYLLKKNSQITTQKLFSLIGSHDQGCGAGGGFNSEMVLDNAGIVILTDLDTSFSPRTHAIGCEEKRRRKRSIADDLAQGMDTESRKCCLLATKPDRYDRPCENRAGIIRNYYRKEPLSNCSNAFLDCCMRYELLITDIPAFSEGDPVLTRTKVQVPLDDDLDEVEFEQSTLVRYDFRETWIYDQLLIGENSSRCDVGIQVMVYMYGVEDLCTGVQAGEKSQRKRITIAPHSQDTVSFPAVPLREGFFPIRVVALSPEGNRCHHTGPPCCGDQYGPTVQTAITGVEHLMSQPTGCGEQTMIRMAPTLYALHYLTVKKQVTPEIEEKAYQYLKEENAVLPGYKRALTYRKYNGAFSVWTTHPPSNWLTAFILKIFCQARQYIPIDDVVISRGLHYLSGQQDDDGSFREVYTLHHPEMLLIRRIGPLKF